MVKSKSSVGIRKVEKEKKKTKNRILPFDAKEQLLHPLSKGIGRTVQEIEMVDLETSAHPFHQHFHVILHFQNLERPDWKHWTKNNKYQQLVNLNKSVPERKKKEEESDVSHRYTGW